MRRYRLTVREGSSVRRSSFGELAGALDALEDHGRDLEQNADASPVRLPLVREFDPVQQVIGRLELRGRGTRAGVDVRGDGSSEAWTGRLTRRLVEQRDGESPYDALRRELS